MTQRLSASVADKIIACPASANLDVAIPGWEPPVVDEMGGAKGHGTNLHAMLEPIAGLTTSDLRHMVSALGYFLEVREQRRFKVETERTFSAKFLTGSPKTTVDVLLHLNDELHVFDWKTGKIHVDVNDNSQLKYYALAALEEGLAPKAKGVHLHIVQPWANNMESTYVTIEELEEFKQVLIETDRKVQAKDTTFGVSDHCKFCPAFPHSRGDKGSPLCPAAMQMLYPVFIDVDEMFKD